MDGSPMWARHSYPHADEFQRSRQRFPSALTAQPPRPYTAGVSHRVANRTPDAPHPHEALEVGLHATTDERLWQHVVLDLPPEGFAAALGRWAGRQDRLA